MRVERFQVGPYDNNLYLLTNAGSRDAIVVDPSVESERVLDTIRTRGLEVKRILLTHAHIDHIVMVAPFHEATGAPVWLHAMDRPLYERGADQAAALGFPWHGTTPIAHWIAEGEEVGIAGMPVKALHTPGHSPGSVTFATEEGLLVGDVLFRESIGRTDLPGGDPALLHRSIKERLFVYPGATAVYPGHGLPTTIEHELKTNPFVGAPAFERA
ncbi:MAG TPA: MBL fold metallo-hydrolase [Candidatus Eisenbacteria bacterium]